MVEDLRYNDRHGEILRVCSHVAEHHDTRQSHVPSGVPQKIDHSCYTSGIHDHLG